MEQRRTRPLLDTAKALARAGYRAARSTYHQVRGIAPSLPVASHDFTLARLGSDYGGWTFVDNDRLNSSTIVSCGLGEDASFDIEFSARYNAKVLIVDPTPRAIDHYNQFMSRVGMPRSQPYVAGGKQPVAAYDLSGTAQDQLILCPKALWTENTKLRFFLPKDATHVSHSIINYQNAYAATTDYIEVEAVTFDTLLDDYGIQGADIVKLDIEGAEIEVLQDMMEKGITPTQLLVEFDELIVPSKRSKQRIETAHRSLVAAGYTLIHREHTNFLYVHHSIR